MRGTCHGEAGPGPGLSTPPVVTLATELNTRIHRQGVSDICESCEHLDSQTATERVRCDPGCDRGSVMSDERRGRGEAGH